MKTITTEVYTFNELSPEAKEKAIKAVRSSDGCLDYEWWDGVYDRFREEMKNHGIEVDQMCFSGFWSQGDGASFTGTITLTQEQVLESLPQRLREKFITFNTKLKLLGHEPMTMLYSAAITQSGRYSHENTMYIVDDYNNCEITESDVDDSPLLDELVELRDAMEGRVEYDEAALEIARDHARALYRQLEEEYEYLNSDEVLTEFITANDYEFTKDGSLY